MIQANLIKRDMEQNNIVFIITKTTTFIVLICLCHLIFAMKYKKKIYFYIKSKYAFTSSRLQIIVLISITLLNGMEEIPS